MHIQYLKTTRVRQIEPSYGSSLVLFTNARQANQLLFIFPAFEKSGPDSCLSLPSGKRARAVAVAFRYPLVREHVLSQYGALKRTFNRSGFSTGGVEQDLIHALLYKGAPEGVLNLNPLH
jgi:hypothetical protein